MLTSSLICKYSSQVESCSNGCGHMVAHSASIIVSDLVLSNIDITVITELRRVSKSKLNINMSNIVIDKLMLHRKGSCRTGKTISKRQ